MSDSDGDCDGNSNGYFSEESYGGDGGYSSEENYGGGGYSSEEDDSGGGYSSGRNDGDGDGGYASEENPGGGGSGGYPSEENYGSGGGYSSEDGDQDEYYGGETETDPDLDEEDGKGYESEDPREVVRPYVWSYESENTSKFHYNDHQDGKNYTSKLTKGCKTQEFVEKRTGNPGFKEEMKSRSYHKVDDKIEGLKTEYETTVKTSKKVTSTKGSRDVIKNSTSYAAPYVPSSSLKRRTIK